MLALSYNNSINITTAIMEKKIGTPDTLYYNYPHFYHWKQKRGMT